eukprot:m.16176 g.16176  ORF g.16176 m.16176 type:complete len:393 (-) comp5021_c0_seq1:366-1544(-)
MNVFSQSAAEGSQARSPTEIAKHPTAAGSLRPGTALRADPADPGQFRQAHSACPMWWVKLDRHRVLCEGRARCGGGGKGSSAETSAEALALPEVPKTGWWGSSMHTAPAASLTRDKRRDPTTVASYDAAVAFSCGLASGVVQAGLFNPYDRALYLTVYHKRPFLTKENFRSPYQGFLQVVWIRAISGGLFYPLEDFFIRHLDAHQTAPLAAGSLAGIFSSGILNPLQAVKYRTWGKQDPKAVWHEAARMWRNGGWAPFMNGLWPRVARDTLFGATYTSLRFRWADDAPEGYTMITNTAAAATATVVSGPLNYVQNIQYGTSSRETQLTIRQALRALVQEAAGQPTLHTKVGLIQDRLRIGWGTVRVAVGMAFGNLLYDRFVEATEGLIGVVD